MTAWDEAKRAKNLAKHGVDLALARLFEHEAALVDEDRSQAYGEQRFRAIGPISDRLFVYVYTMSADGEGDHAISLRCAEPKEARFYARNI